MKSKLLALVLLAGGSLFAGPRVFVGVGFGGGYVVAPPPPVVTGYVPVAPGPGYAWVGGYYYPAGPRYAWHAGYWAPRPYAGAYWVAPRYNGGRYYRGYWRR
jgi:hypothetical protein